MRRRCSFYKDPEREERAKLAYLSPWVSRTVSTARQVSHMLPAFTYPVSPQSAKTADNLLLAELVPIGVETLKPEHTYRCEMERDSGHASAGRLPWGQVSPETE